LVRAKNRWRGHAAGAAGTDFTLPSRPVNHLLEQCFAGERKRLVRMALGEPLRPYARGVSLMALLQRQEGVVLPRSKPDSLPADQHDPMAALATAGDH